MADLLVIPYEPWQRDLLLPSTLDLECLLPTGVYISLVTNASATLSSIKAAIWREAQKNVFYRLLENCANYVFVGVTIEAPHVREFYDETRSVRDLRLFLPILKLKEVFGNRDEKRTSEQIGEVCGVAVSEFDKWTEPDVVGYRYDLLEIAKEVVELRNKGGQRALAAYYYPSQLENEETYQKDVRNALEGDVELVLSHPKSKKISVHKIHVTYTDMPFDVVFRCLVVSVKMDFYLDSPGDRDGFAERNYENFVLKICGRESYFLTLGKPFIQYKYVRNNLVYNRPIKITLVPRDALYASVDAAPMSFPTIKRPVLSTTSINAVTTWDCNKNKKLSVKPTGIMKLVSGSAERLYIRLGIYHGTEPLCPPIETPDVPVSNPRWSETLTFDILIRNLPRAAKLCMAVCTSIPSKKRDRSISADAHATPTAVGAVRSASLSRGARREHDHIGLTWANVNLFNARGELLSGPATIAMWPTAYNVIQAINPCGQPGSNPNKGNAGHLTLRFDSFEPAVTFPSYQRFLDIATVTNREEMKRLTADGAPQFKDLNSVRALAKRDPLYELTEQEKELLWNNRYQCQQVPECLPKLLGAVTWSSSEEVSEIYGILTRWPSVPPVVALELMDFKYPDPQVRKLAVHSLDDCSDTELEHYLLQLVQVLKTDAYLNTSVAHFLLRRGVQNRRIGHLLFWLLKAEMHDPNLLVRFGCLLEALCRGSGAYIKALGREVVALGKLKDLSELVIRGDENKRFVMEQLKLEQNCSSLDQLPSPLDCDDTLGELNASLCGVLSSAKRPLWLVWSNPDPFAEYYFKKHEIIFKNGDDLRQDMLTLQVIGLMDGIWQTEDLNLRMIPYGCLPTGKNTGVIEVVRMSKTVLQIQKEIGGFKSAMQTDNTALLKWLQQMNQAPAEYERAVDNFTHSCAGYCVATFILGIGDRHPDNIMLTENGQLFHIDFGHFLGHFKKKFGINRERVPFVLTGDFIAVIARGADTPQKTTEYQQFVQLCCNAYRIMREHANLIIALFTMMLGTGIEELQTFDDVAYLRNTLAVDKSEADAERFFKSKIEEAFDDAWTTKVDWFFHHVRHIKS